MNRRRALVPASLSLLALSAVLPATALARPSSSYVVPPLPSVFAKNVDLGSSAETFRGDAALDPTGTSHLAWVTATGSSEVITTCTLHRGAKHCSATSQLVPNSASTDLGPPQVLITAPNTLEIIATACCSQPEGSNPVPLQWTSTDNGTTWSLGPSGLTIRYLDDSINDTGTPVFVGTYPDGTIMEEAGAGAPVQVGTTLDPAVGAKLAVDLNGGLLVASATASSNSLPETTYVTYQSSPGAPISGGASFPGETLQSIASGPGGPWLMTRKNTSGVLDPPVLLRHWNGTSFDAAKTLGIPGQGDDQNFNLSIDRAGRLHALWTGARENYRLWHAVSSDGGKTWAYTLLDNNVNAAGFYPVLDRQGIGIMLEVPAGGTGHVIVQPLLVTPTFSIRAKPTFAAGVVESVTISGTVASPSSGARIGAVAIQKLIGKHWITLATTHLNKSGGFSVPVKPGKVGTTSHYRAYTDGIYGYYDSGTSPSVTARIPIPKS